MGAGGGAAGGAGGGGFGPGSWRGGKRAWRALTAPVGALAGSAVRWGVEIAGAMQAAALVVLENQTRISLRKMPKH